MKTSLFIISMVCTFLACAQKELKKPVPEPMEYKTVKLSKFPLANFPSRSIAVSDIRIIQSVSDSVNMGYAFKGIDGYVITLKIEKPLTAFLQNQLNRMYKSEYREEGAKILFVLKDLRLGERTAFSKYAYIRVNADTYISKDGFIYKPVCSIDTVLIKESGSDVTAWHGEDIEEGLRVLVKRTLKAAKEVIKLDIKEITIEEIIAQTTVHKEYPIMSATAYREGAYASFEEFIQNNPSIIDFEPVVVEKKKVRFIRSKGQQDTLAIWGVCQKGEIYKYYDESLVSIEKEGKGFIISNYIENTNKRNRNIFFLSLLGGVAGGITGGITVSLIANAVKTHTLLVKTYPYISNPNKQPIASCIDMKTGELSF